MNHHYERALMVCFARVDGDQAEQSSTHAPTSSQEIAKPPELLHPGYIGEIGFNEIFRESRATLENAWIEPLVNVKRTLFQVPYFSSMAEDRIHLGAKILPLLEKFDMIAKLIEEFYLVSFQVIAPWQTVQDILASLRDIIPEVRTERSRKKLAAKLLYNTCSPIEIDENVTAQNFHERFTGKKLRWEVLGSYLR